METLTDQIAAFCALADAPYDWEEWVDQEGNIRYISLACLRIAGYDPEEFLANHIWRWKSSIQRTTHSSFLIPKVYLRI
jgi:PAS domain-containing protein